MMGKLTAALVALLFFAGQAVAADHYLGTVFPAPGPNGTSAGIVPVVSTSAESSHVIKGAPGSLYGGHATVTTVSGYLMIFDATSAPVDGAVAPKACLPITSNGTNGGIAINYTTPAQYLTGVTVVFSSTGCFTKTASATAYFSFQVQ